MKKDHTGTVHSLRKLTRNTQKLVPPKIEEPSPPSAGVETRFRVWMTERGAGARLRDLLTVAGGVGLDGVSFQDHRVSARLHLLLFPIPPIS